MSGDVCLSDDSSARLFHTHHSGAQGVLCYLAGSLCCVCRPGLFAEWSRGSQLNLTSRRRWSVSLGSGLRCWVKTRRLGPDYTHARQHITSLWRHSDTKNTTAYKQHISTHHFFLCSTSQKVILTAELASEPAPLSSPASNTHKQTN